MKSLEETRARNRSYYQSNKDRRIAQAKAWHAANPEKVKAAKIRWRQANPDKQKRAELKSRCGITPEDVEDLLCQQAGLCALCCMLVDPNNFEIDHCHKTDQIRGLLHHACNIALGHFEKIYLDAPAYLEASCVA